MGKIDQSIIDKVIQLFHQEVIPAEGCTEPIAIALAAAKATQVLGQKPERIKIMVSGNIIKNVKSVIVPNSGGMVGIGVSAAMGALAGDPDAELMVISHVSAEDMSQVKEFLEHNTIEISRADNNLKLYVKIEVIAGKDSASVELKHFHTNITEITKNGQVLLKLEDNYSSAKQEDAADILTIKLVYEIAKLIDLKQVKERLDKVISCNTAISSEGLNGNYGANVGKNIMLSIKKGFYGNDSRNHSASVAAAASDARMGGSAMPVMTSAGSGNVGLSASLPIITYCRDNNIDEDTMYRGLFFSIMATLHIKASIGRLSAYCGPMCASGAVAGALGFINGADCITVENAITNTLAGVSGVVCDGANSSCPVKIANGTYAAFDGIAMAMNGSTITSGDGIVAGDVEATIKNIGQLAREGMQETDEVILKIMTRS